MTRAKISEYSATANDNTDVNGVDIAEGCPPSSMNNMGREIMAALKRFQVGSDGDGVTVGGALVVSGATTANTFTASGPSVISVNSSSDALRITQIGAGNALVVEDSANPDASPLVVDASGRVIIGHTASQTFIGLTAIPLQINGLTQGTSSQALANWGNVTSPTSLNFSKSRGGAVGTQTILNNADDIGAINFEGSDGTAFIPAAQILAEVDGTPGTNDMPGRLTFSTTADGASSPTERMRIDSAGRVGIGTTPIAGNALTVRPNFEAVTSANSVVLNNFIVGSTTNARGYLSNIGATATAVTTGLSHFIASQATFTSGHAVQNQYGFNADSSLTGATNNYGFYSNIASGSGRWNFFANGTAANYMAGTLEVGSTIGVGDATPAASGAGITFPATQSASSDANTLDDYEEGTWTPAVIGSGTAGTYETSSATGTYTKIGRQVTVNATIQLAAVITGGGTGGLRVSGIPFSFADTNAYGAVMMSGVDVDNNTITLTSQPQGAGTTRVLFLETWDNAPNSSVAIADVAATDAICFSLTYNI